MLNTGLSQREVQGESGRRRGLKSGSWEDLGAAAATKRQKHEMASVSTIEPARLSQNVVTQYFFGHEETVSFKNRYDSDPQSLPDAGTSSAFRVFQSRGSEGDIRELRGEARLERGMSLADSTFEHTQVKQKARDQYGCDPVASIRLLCTDSKVRSTYASRKTMIPCPNNKSGPDMSGTL